MKIVTINILGICALAYFMAVVIGYLMEGFKYG